MKSRVREVRTAVFVGWLDLIVLTAAANAATPLAKRGAAFYQSVVGDDVGLSPELARMRAEFEQAPVPRDLQPPCDAPSHFSYSVKK